MKRLFLLAVLLLCLAIPSWTQAQNAPGKAGGKVLLVVRDSKPAAAEVAEIMVTKEAEVMKRMLQEAGYVVEIAAPTMEPWGPSAIALQPDRKLSDVNVAEYRAIVIPCLGIASDALRPELASVIKAAAAAGTLLAGQNGGVIMLAKAGVLDGKRYAAIELVPEMGKGTYTGPGIVKDGRIITSGTCPGTAALYNGTEDGTQKLMEVVLAELR